MAVTILILAVVGYLLGSINASIVVSRIFMGYDIRTKGSGNAGLTNSFRCMGAKPTLFVLVGDIAKAVIASVIGGMLMGPLGTLIAGSGAIIGHMFPLYFRFKGGKGILVGGTMICVFDWRIFCIVIAVFFVLVGITKWVSLGSIAATSLVPFLTLYFYRNDPTLLPMAIILFVMAAAVVYMHRANIVRIAHGKENKFSLHSGEKK
ncbi:MAG: glycerol-3-phosphate 1-O-acyltransferase PlsY [Clostridia bacterium]|nr:glycerol-3-phosphate 1-O-acyltransferase PlsY [Clostridia bacterium]